MCVTKTHCTPCLVRHFLISTSWNSVWREFFLLRWCWGCILKSVLRKKKNYKMTKQIWDRYYENQRLLVYVWCHRLTWIMTCLYPDSPPVTRTGKKKIYYRINESIIFITGARISKGCFYFKGRSHFSFFHSQYEKVNMRVLSDSAVPKQFKESHYPNYMSISSWNYEVSHLHFFAHRVSRHNQWSVIMLSSSQCWYMAITYCA